jgi:hypothetical protein
MKDYSVGVGRMKFFGQIPFGIPNEFKIYFIDFAGLELLN